MTPLLLAGQPNTRTCCFSRASQTGATLIRYCHSKISNRGQQRGRSCKVVCKNGAQHASEVVQAGDTATIHFTAYGEQGQRLESTKDAGQALNFEVGSSNAVGNDLLQIFDEGIVGMRVGETRQVTLESVQDDWNKELVFSVPREHAEVQRLEGKFRSSGGLNEGMIVELANGQQAQVVKLAPDVVILDANHAMAGRKLNFDVELIDLEKANP